jgi:hypothetical protein
MEDVMSTDRFDRALLRWEAQREIDALWEQHQTIHAEAKAKAQPIKDEIDRLKAEFWPKDFSEALWDAGLSWECFRLREIGVVTFEDLEDATDDELLAIDRVGPVTLGRLREFQAEWAE